jgi:outer membrane lipase/esterase
VLQEIVAAPNAYGFTNVTGTACKSQITANSLTCNPTSRHAECVVDLRVRRWRAPDHGHPPCLAVRHLGDRGAAPATGAEHSAQVTGRADQVAWHRAGAGRRRAELVGQRARRPAALRPRRPVRRPGAGRCSAWTGPAAAWTLGGFAGYGRVKADFGNSQGDFTQKDTTLGVFAAGRTQICG